MKSNFDLLDIIAHIMKNYFQYLLNEMIMFKTALEAAKYKLLARLDYFR